MSVPSLLESLESRRMLALAAYFEEVPMKSAAVADDPILASYRTWDLKVRVYSGDTYLVSDLVGNSGSGTFYNSPFGGMS